MFDIRMMLAFSSARAASIERASAMAVSAARNFFILYDLRVAASAVQTKDGDTVLKYVNTLDQAVSITVTLDNAKGIPASAKRTVLTGPSFTGKEYTLTDNYIKLGEKFTVNLPAHSMTVIRF